MNQDRSIFTSNSKLCSRVTALIRRDSGWFVPKSISMLASLYKYFTVALLSFASPLSTSSVDDNFSKLRAAVSDNDVSTVNQLLLQNSTDWLTENRGWEITCIAAEKGNLPVIKYIAKFERSIFEKKNPQRIAEIAAKNGHLDVVCYVAMKHMQSCTDFKDIIPIAMKTSRKRDPKTLELWGKLADEWWYRYCPNIVKLASEANNTHLLEYLAEKKCTYFLKCRKYSTCESMRIAFKQNLVNPNFLDCLEKGNGTIQGYIGESNFTIGHLAADYDRIDVIQFLVEKNASNLEKVDIYGQKVVDIAADHGYADIVRYVIRQNPSTTVLEAWNICDRLYQKSITAFYLAVAKNWMDMDTLKYVIEKVGPDLITTVNWVDGRTVAHAAAANANMEILQYLVKKDASLLSKTDAEGDTPLHILARRNTMSVENWRYFSNNGASSLLAYNNLKENIPILAAENGNLEFLRFLVQKETSVFEGNPTIGVEVAEKAASCGHSNILKFIVDKKPILLADRPDILFKLPKTSQILDMLQYLKTACDTKITNWDCRPFESEILRQAFEYDYPDVIRFMEYDVNMVNDRGEPLVFIAIRRNRSNILHFLAENVKTNLTALDRDGNNILFIAAMNHDVEKLKYILEKLKPPIDIEWRNHNGDSLLKVAADAASDRLDSATCKEHQNAIRVWKYLVDRTHRVDDARERGNKTRATSRANTQ